MPQVALVIGAVVAVAGVAVQVQAQKKAAKAQKKRAGVQRRESIRRSIRQTQRQRAQALAAAEIRGAGTVQAPSVVLVLCPHSLAKTSGSPPRLGRSTTISLASTVVPR